MGCPAFALVIAAAGNPSTGRSVKSVIDPTPVARRIVSNEDRQALDAYQAELVRMLVCRARED
jgi:hypothetical protein